MLASGRGLKPPADPSRSDRMKPVMLLVLPLLLNATAADQSPALEFTFIGNEAVAVSDGRMLLVSDYPYKSGVFGSMRYDPSLLQPAGRSVVLLITHRHDDHFDPRAVTDSSWRVIGPDDVTSKLPPARVIRLDSVMNVGGAKIRPVVTPHARVGHNSYLVEWAGRRIYFVGDTDDPTALLAQRNLDIAFVTSWLWRRTKSRNGTIDARQVVIYHHATGESVAGCTGACRIPAQGDRWRL